MSNNTNSQAVTPYKPRGGALAEVSTSFELSTFQEVVSFAEVMQQSGLFPDVTTAARGVVKIMAGKELGLGPMTSLAKIDVVQGRVRLSAELMASIIKRSRDWDYRVLALTNELCEIRFFFKGEALAPTVTYTRADAQLAGNLEKDTYKKHPRNMLFARCLMNGARWHCPHLFGSAIDNSESPTYEEDGEVHVSGPTPPTVDQAVHEAEQNQIITQVPNGQTKRFATVFGWPDRTLADIIDAEPREAPAQDPREAPAQDPQEQASEPITEEEIEAAGTAIPDEIMAVLRRFGERYLVGEEVPWNDDPKKRVAPGKASNDRLKLFEFSGEETAALYSLVCFVMTGEVVPLLEAGKAVSGRLLAAIQVAENAEITSLKPAAAWWLQAMKARS